MGESTKNSSAVEKVIFLAASILEQGIISSAQLFGKNTRVSAIRKRHRFVFIIFFKKNFFLEESIKENGRRRGRKEGALFKLNEAQKWECCKPKI